eukprot:gene14120-15205_t
MPGARRSGGVPSWPPFFSALLRAAAEDRGGWWTESTRSAVDLWLAVKRMQEDAARNGGRLRRVELPWP